MSEIVGVRKGRGFEQKWTIEREEYQGPEQYETLPMSRGSKYQKSVEGWIIMVTGVHEEAQEDVVMDKFSEFGIVKDLHLNLDRRTGFVKGYCFLEYEKYEEAQAAVEAMDGSTLYEKVINVDFAFLSRPHLSSTREE